MDFEYSDSDYMQKLYEEFRKHVYDNDLTTVSYTTDELLDIYDCAVDFNDSLVQMFVFDVAAAQFPGNDFLDERKAFFLAQFDEKAAHGMLNRKGRAESALWKVLEISDSSISPEEWEQRFSELLASDMRFSSETVIRLVEIARETDHLDWLIEQIDLLKSKAEHPEVVLNEIGHAIYEDGAQTELGIAIVEELTANNPFNPDFWVLLGSLQRAEGHYTEALSSCDYALAIAPDHANALAAKGFTLALSGDRNSLLQAVELIETAHKKLPDDNFLTEQLAQTYIALNKRTLAGETYLDMMRDHSCATYSLSKIAEFSPRMFGKGIETFAAIIGNDESRWLEAARLLLSDDKGVDRALTLLKYFHQRFGLLQGLPLYLELLYKQRKYKEYIGLCDTMMSVPKTDSYTFRLTPLYLLMLASAYLQTGDRLNAQLMCNFIRAYPQMESMPSDATFRRGIDTSLLLIENIIKQKSEIPVDKDWDPLTLSLLPEA